MEMLLVQVETTKKAVLEQIRDTEMLRSLICLADDVTNARWYPANVGPNLLLIMQDLCRLPSTVMEEQPKMVILYDMITIMLRSALAMLVPRLDLVIEQGKGAVGHLLRGMGAQEELLMRNIVLTYRVIEFGNSSIAITAIACAQSVVRLFTEPFVAVEKPLKCFECSSRFSKGLFTEMDWASVVS